MINRVFDFLRELRDRQRITAALAKGGAMMGARDIDLTSPATWEFSGFSQNGEDGVLDILRRQLLKSNRYFVEIGAADGIENNTAWLLVAEQYGGLMIEGNPALSARARRTVQSYSIGAECHAMFVTAESAASLLSVAMHHDPDVFSLDIDGNDYYVAKALLDAGLRPKIVVAEYNAVYGPERSLTVKYAARFNFRTAHPTELYYGVSVSGWRRLLEPRGYRFVTVERNGVNAFFVDPEHFRPDFLAAVRGLNFAENLYQLRKFREPNDQQFKRIANCAFEQI